MISGQPPSGRMCHQSPVNATVLPPNWSLCINCYIRPPVSHYNVINLQTTTVHLQQETRNIILTAVIYCAPKAGRGAAMFALLAQHTTLAVRGPDVVRDHATTVRKMQVQGQNTALTLKAPQIIAGLLKYDSSCSVPCVLRFFFEVIFHKNRWFCAADKLQPD